VPSNNGQVIDILNVFADIPIALSPNVRNDAILRFYCFSLCRELGNSRILFSKSCSLLRARKSSGL
jgi:hypothetical protein